MALAAAGQYEPPAEEKRRQLDKSGWEEEEERQTEWIYRQAVGEVPAVGEKKAEEGESDWVGHRKQESLLLGTETAEYRLNSRLCVCIY